MATDIIDIQTLKSHILELRDVEGLSFQEISDKLATEYGIYKTRQAVGGLYHRTKDAVKGAEDKQRLISDVVNIYCIADSAIQVCDEINKLGIEISYRKVLNIIQENDKYVQSVKRTIVANIESQLDTLTDIRGLKLRFNYKGVKICDKRFNEYFSLACQYHIKNNIITSLLKYYKLSSDRGIIKEVAEKFNLDIRTCDLRQVY